MKLNDSAEHKKLTKVEPFGMETSPVKNSSVDEVRKLVKAFDDGTQSGQSSNHRESEGHGDDETSAKKNIMDIIGKPVLRTSKSMEKLQENRPSYAIWVDEHLPWLSPFAQSSQFEFFMGMIIVFNCITIGIQVHMCPPDSSPRWRPDTCPEVFLGTTEHLCTAIFVFEFIVRGLAFGFRYHIRNVNAILDSCLVWITGVLFGWVLAEHLTGSSFRMLTALRAFRLLRLVRVVRNNDAFKDVWKLLKGLSESASALFATVVIISFVNYLFGILFVTLIGDSVAFGDDEEYREVQDYFAGLDKTMFTLLQIITGDSWASAIARPVIDKMPSMWFVFVLYLALGAFVLLNLITAIIVDNALSESNKSEQEKLLQIESEMQKEFASLLAIFDDIDSDGSGELDQAEFRNCVDERSDVREKFKLLGFEEIEISKLFSDIDTGDGILSLEEFIIGLRSMQGEAKGKDLIRTMRSVERLHKRFDKLEDFLGMHKEKSPCRKAERKTEREHRAHHEPPLLVQDYGSESPSNFSSKAVLPVGKSTAETGSGRMGNKTSQSHELSTYSTDAVPKDYLHYNADLQDHNGRAIAFNDLRNRIWNSLETQVCRLNSLVQEQIQSQIGEITSRTVAMCHAELAELMQRQRQGLVGVPDATMTSADQASKIADPKIPETHQVTSAQGSTGPSSSNSYMSQLDTGAQASKSGTSSDIPPEVTGGVRPRDSWLGM